MTEPSIFAVIRPVFSRTLLHLWKRDGVSGEDDQAAQGLGQKAFAGAVRSDRQAPLVLVRKL